MRIVFWQNVLSPHQASPIRALANRGGMSVVWVAQEGLDAHWRKTPGWTVPNLERVSTIVAPTNDVIDDIIAEKPGESTHIFSGLGAYSMVQQALARCARRGLRIGVQAEAVDESGWKGVLRTSLGRLWRLRWGDGIQFLLGIGRGCEWFSNVGFSGERIYPYIYAVDPPGASASLQPFAGGHEDAAIEITLIAQMIPRKSLDIAFSALHGVREWPWRARVIGVGPLRTALENQVFRLGLAERVRFLGAVDNTTAMEVLAASDLLILPSKHDGWGVVVNEALLRGVPVISSDRCGASELLHAPWRGSIFRAGSAASLRCHIAEWLRRGKRTSDERARIQQWSRCLTGESASEYLQAVLDHVQHSGPKPNPPWRSPD